MKLTFTFSFLLFSIISIAQTRSTQEVYNHHEEAFLNQDVEALLEDYDESSILITPDGKAHKGKTAIKQTFEYAFAELFPPESDLAIIHKVINENLVYLVYSASDASTGEEYWTFATDTFVIEDGKIKYQTVAAQMPETPSINEKKEILRKYFEEVWNKKNFKLLEAITSEPFTFHFGGQKIMASLQEHENVIKNWTTVFPDYTVEIKDMLDEGDKVAVRFEFSGTQQENFSDIESKGQKMKATGIWICSFKDGVITECWEEYDLKGMLDQLKGQ